MHLVGVTHKEVGLQAWSYTVNMLSVLMHEHLPLQSLTLCRHTLTQPGPQTLSSRNLTFLRSSKLQKKKTKTKTNKNWTLATAQFAVLNYNICWQTLSAVTRKGNVNPNVNINSFKCLWTDSSVKNKNPEKLVNIHGITMWYYSVLCNGTKKLRVTGPRQKVSKRLMVIPVEDIQNNK